MQFYHLDRKNFKNLFYSSINLYVTDQLYLASLSEISDFGDFWFW